MTPATSRSGLAEKYTEVEVLNAGDVVTIGTDQLWLVTKVWRLREGWTAVNLLNLETGERFESRTTDAWYMGKVCL